jgi:aminoglycoside 6'-N-acetyltransferase I
MNLRPANETDRAECLRLRCALWPDCSAERHELEMDVVSPDERGVLVLDRGDGQLGGFLEVSVRHGVDGARHEEVAYIEGWYVEPALRGKKWGRALMDAAIRWALERGYTELGSDAEQHNTTGIAAHRAMGFRETFRVTQFLKDLAPD